MFTITISRQTASRGEEIAVLLAGRLGYQLIDRQYVLENWLPAVADEHQLHMLKESSKFYNKQVDEGLTFAGYIEQKLKELAASEPLVILGLGSQVIFRNSPQTVHIKIVASTDYRVERMARKYGLHREQAERTVELSDRKHRRYVWRIYDADWNDLTLYHICLNTDGIEPENAIELLINLIDLKKASPGALEEDKPASLSTPAPDFAHPSEKEFTEILDMHHIRWEYEPTEFPLEWDVEGNVRLGFRPDFYLPEYDTYIELTTMKRQYVTEKNKKVKLLQEIYPDINIKIVYKKDFYELIERFRHNNKGD